MMKKRNIIIGGLLIIVLTFFITDFCLEKANKSPVFAIPMVRYKDGGSIEYYGLGYKVIKYSNLTGSEIKMDFGTWFMKFSPPKYKIIELKK
ncbi:hypothetical protein [Clostridium estertheticum]|uniref:hypothetical protein n=1 Tax=Clostridium estertheticum TaxID=238834 RepID=UPI001CF1E49C|nr:hypothetical protein [Clostridium estertheticum]MCB2341049.1 hypothetical protein [Clostridium estertheticum]